MWISLYIPTTWNLFFFFTYLYFGLQQLAKIARTFPERLLILQIMPDRHDFACTRRHSAGLRVKKVGNRWPRERIVMSPAKVGRASVASCLVSFKPVRPENFPSNCGWITLLCWEIREPWGLIGCTAAGSEEKVIPAVPGMQCLRCTVQNKIKKKERSFCLKGKWVKLMGKQAVQIPSNSNENKMDNNRGITREGVSEEQNLCSLSFFF